MLPYNRVYSDAFRERGIADVVKIDVFPLGTAREIVITFISASSKLRQGVWLRTDGGVWINGSLHQSVDLWYDSAKGTAIHCNCISSDGIMHIYNIWERDNIRSALCYSSGMKVQNIPKGRCYNCNDIGFDTSFNKLVFSVELESEVHADEARSLENDK